MSIDEARMPGAVRRVAIAVTHGDAPVIVAASDDTVLTRAVALHLVADPRSISPGAVAAIREALLEERWSDAAWEWMDATGEVLDAYRRAGLERATARRGARRSRAPHGPHLSRLKEGHG
jgi:hypothetical protein